MKLKSYCSLKFFVLQIDAGDDSPTGSATTMIRFAIAHGHLEMLKFLIDDMNFPCKKYAEHYGYASFIGSQPIIDFLDSKNLWNEDEKRKAIFDEIEGQKQNGAELQKFTAVMKLFLVECQGKNDITAYEVAGLQEQL
jgi:hypothetical protein